MTRVLVRSVGVSIDGYSAGPDQDLAHPLGAGGEALFDWAWATRTFRVMHGHEGGSTDVDDQFAARGFENVGAWILGRNMFGPVRGPWRDDAWKGWWGDTPPYHVPVFVLTHHPRESIPMNGGTTFHFVTDGIHAALDRARAAANGRDVRIGGGASTIRQYVSERLIDELHLVVSPVLLGKGESLFANVDWPALGYRCTEHVSSGAVTHLAITGGVGPASS